MCYDFVKMARPVTFFLFNGKMPHEYTQTNWENTEKSSIGLAEEQQIQSEATFFDS